MSNTSLFLLINGLAGKVPPIDEFFKGAANDYFLPVVTCLILVALWFGTRDIRQREMNQSAIVTAVISIGIVNGLIHVSNYLYFAARPFNALPPGSINLLFYKPTDSTFPSNFAAVLFAIAIPILTKNRKIGIVLLFLALLGGFAGIYVGIHYPLDILGGAAFGTLASFLAYGVSRVLGSAFANMLSFMREIHLA
jgi:undecaprenyl-diphosphatase